MKYKEFVDWCNQRACDGCWGLKEAMWCCDMITEVNNASFFKKKKKWLELEPFATKIVIETNKLIDKYRE